MIDQLEIVTDLLYKCRKEEIKTFRAYLKVLDSGSSTFRNKSVRVLDVLLKNRNISNEILCEKIYEKVSDKNKVALKRLVNRFKEKLYECLTLDVNIYRVGSYTELTQYKAEMRKLILYNTLLGGKVNKQEFFRMVDRTLLIARKYELYHDMINLLMIKSEHLRIYTRFSKIKGLNKEIDFYIYCSRAVQIAKDWHHKLILDVTSKAGGYSIIEDFKLAIKELEESHKVYNSANIKFYLLMIQMEYAHKIYDFTFAEKISHEQINLFKSSPSVSLNIRLAGAFLNLGNNQLYLFKFKDAINNIKNAYSTYSVNLFNLNIAKEIEIYVQFYLGELNAAEKITKEIINNGVNVNTPFQISKRSFLLANILFLKKQHKEAHRILQDTKEIERDKEGWNLGIRILSIINQLEGEKLDIVDLNIESLRKHIDRTIKMKAVRKRDVVILRLLAKLSRQGFNFKAVWKKNLKYFEMLASDDPEYRWEMKSPEMIIFHKWFEAKAKGREYDYVLKSPESLRLS